MVKPRYIFSTCIALILCVALARAEDAPASKSRIDIAGLKNLLVELGYEVEELKSGETPYLQAELKHASETRKHIFSVDTKADTIIILAGGFSWAPDPKKASNDWFVKLMKLNNRIAPTYIFLNDGNVFGLTTVMGNVDMSAERLKAKIKEHVTNFDEQLVPLVKELPGPDKSEGKP